ncbi:MAG TPA: AAA family ATPase [Gaiellaceae bacterium]|nr:AAA family ATPase [Gaiellaceae bacterium]
MPAPVLGRETERQAILDALDETGAGAAVVVVAGEPGIGKTTLWHDAVANARGRSFHVLAARPGHADEQLPFAALADLLEDVAEDVLAGLPDPQSFALSVALMRETPVGRIDRRAVSAATLSVIRALAAEAPLLVAVDDVHRLDSPTARVLEFVVRRIAALPVVVLACRRTGTDATAQLAVEDGVPAERFRRLELGPLSAAALQRLIVDRFGRALPRRTLLRVADAAAGNPFYALEIARLLPPDGAMQLRVLPVPGSLQELVDERLARLPRRVRTALLYAAASRAATTELLPADARRALAAAAEAEIADVDGVDIRFRHPLYAEALLASASTGELRSVHRRLAARAPTEEIRVRHLALAVAGTDDDLATRLERAAAEAQARGAPEAAAELAEQARRLTPHSRPDALRRRTIDVAEYLSHAGELARAVELLEVASATAAPGVVHARALHLLADARAAQQSIPEAVAMLEQARDEAGDDPVLAPLIVANLAYMRINLGELPRARVDVADALGRLGGDSPMLAVVLATSAMIECMLGEGVDRGRVERALVLEDHDVAVPVALRPSTIAGLLALYLGELDEACRLLGALRRRLLERGQEAELVFVDFQLAWAESRRGDLRRSRELVDEARELAAGIRAAPLTVLALAGGALVSALQGDVASARRDAAEALELGTTTGYAITEGWWRQALGVLELSLGNPTAAVVALEPLLPVAEAGIGEPVLVFWLPDAVEALVEAGELARAEPHVEAFAAAAKRLDRAWALGAAARCRAVLHAARGELEPALAAVDEALAQHDRAPAPLERARTLLVKGVVERRLKRKRAAAASIAQAADVFAAAGAHLWEARAREELRRVGLRPRAPDDLTASELRVAELASSGLSNAQIAAAAFMTEKTVEANLTRVYRKLGIRSRAQLGTRLAERVSA